jgi:hypothetical protein
MKTSFLMRQIYKANKYQEIASFCKYIKIEDLMDGHSLCGCGFCRPS